ncbi:MAG: hypothetical protein EZS26_000606 [Candidatus Ordinivivax streblomastigis]|uniref:Right handed beta helix domain-containing protein n=1 Tax=Candidatus Ordinivivax streblomastigis TaxID=2540710 RepID=A0A5M8P474_9BACT|nr:MAG: hypothetical protein EZS26_000361 [Candidatus Ordinivivax streblomastigis]KAA6303446.1 MAG: hypothetical protein EZS26_000606 [Candidatus Ordinivivax streblomastigis]
MKKVFLFLMSIILSVGYADSQTIFYVDPVDGDQFNDGDSWNSPYGDLTDALLLAVAGDEIWIKGGELYTAPQPLVDGVSIYGSFDGTETSKDQRKKVVGGKPWEFQTPTILKNNGATIFNANVAATISIDGITFEANPDAGNARAINISNGGNAKGYVIQHCVFKNFTSNADGGAINMRAKALIAYCLFTGNYGNKGGGAYLDYSTIHDCEIINNHASAAGTDPINSGNGGGGGILLANNNTVAYNCLIKGNSASFGGGAMVRTNTSMYNCILIDNTAAKSGGGISFDGRDNGGVVYNVTLANNTAETADGAGGICFTTGGKLGDSPRIQKVYNSILYNNTNTSGVANIGKYVASTDPAGTVEPVFQNNIIDSKAYNATINVGYTTIGDNCILASDPSALFVDQIAYITKPGFPGQNKGLSSGLTLPEKDMAGNTRIIKGAIDIGPFEIEELEQIVEPNSNNVIFVNVNTTVSDDPYVMPIIGNTWATAIGSLPEAITGAVKYREQHPEKTLEVWVKAGTYNALSIELKDGISLYGGFAGTETALNERVKGAHTWDYTNETVLTGAGRERTSASDAIGSKAVIKQDSLFVHPVLVDGFTLTGGEHGALFISGGNTTLRNSILRQNGSLASTSSYIATGIDGGGVAIRGGAFTVTSCLIEENEAKSGGGVLIANDAPSVVRNCTIRENKALVTANTPYNFTSIGNPTVFGWGGGVFNQGGSVNNCLIEENTSFAGGGIFIRDNESKFNNCIIVKNNAVYGAGVSYDPRTDNASTNNKVFNCLIAENQALGVTAFEDYLKDAATEPNGIGGGVYLTFETQAIYNTIFTGNKEDNNDVSDTQGGFPNALHYCISDNPNTDQEDEFLIQTTAGQITYDANWNITSANFPGVDAGFQGEEPEPSNPTSADYLGNERVFGDRIDIGPFEFGAPQSNGVVNPGQAIEGTVVAVRYYNLQGVEIKQPVSGSIYIEKKIYDNQEIKATKKWGIQ